MTSKIITFILNSTEELLFKTQLKKEFPNQEEAMQQAIDYCKVGDFILEIDEEKGIYEKKPKRGIYTFYRAQDSISLLNRSFRASELCEKWRKKYHKEVIYAAIKKLLREGILSYNKKFVQYKVKRKV